MISKYLNAIILKEGWKDGSTWEFDWYIDLIFCHAMAYGTSPFELRYIQPILDDEYINTKLNDDIVERYRPFFRDATMVKNLISKQVDILSRATDLINVMKIRSDDLDLKLYYKSQYDLSLLMASVSAVLDKLIEDEINLLADTHDIKTELLSNYVIDRSSVTQLSQSNKALLGLYSKQRTDFDAYFISGKLSADLQNELIQHKQKYGWINTGERGKRPWEIQDFLTQLNNLLSVNKVEGLDVPEPIMKALEHVVEININDNKASDLQIELDFLFQEYLSKKLGKAYSEAIFERLSFEEIEHILQNPSEPPSVGVAKHRLAYPYKGRVEVLELSESDYILIKKLIKKDIYDSQEIRGRPACQGVVEGYVNIVRNLDDLDNFNEGSILVAEKTQPSYVMIMKKATAIVTDIGGITSHAAIVSREFNIPCVVATGNATKLLKNGDRIRVDAFTGVIMKLEQ